MSDETPLPIATATIARLYLLQGKPDKAEAIYRRLLRESPDDTRLLAGLAEVEQRARAMEAFPSDDHLETTITEDKIICRWSITDEGKRRARLVLENAGEIFLRLVTFPLSSDRPPKDIPLEHHTGELTLPLMNQALLIAASVGLCGSDGCFASITHCTTLTPLKEDPIPS